MGCKLDQLALKTDGSEVISQLSINPGFIGALNAMKSHRLEEVTTAGLMNRVDSKFLLPVTEIEGLLKHLRDEYSALQIGNARITGYNNHYFDTEDFQFFCMHQNGRLSRFKVRCRSYEQTANHFMEVKEKTNKGRTVKRRIPLASKMEHLHGEAAVFVNTCLSGDGALLENKLQINYKRVSLMNRSRPERLTLDLDLEYGRPDRSKPIKLHGLAVVELKQSRLNQSASVFQYLRRLGLRPTKFSKYCMGCATSYPITANRFKPLLRRIQANLEYPVND